MTKILHATAVAIGAHGVLLMGNSGAGKSDMALRLIDRGALLISDDAVTVSEKNCLPWLSAAPNVEGQLEVRGVGICAVPNIRGAHLRLVVDLVDTVDRMPETTVKAIQGFHVPSLKLLAFENSAVIKLELAVRATVDAGRWPVAIENVTSEESIRA